jgi:hypothetical protein
VSHADHTLRNVLRFLDNAQALCSYETVALGFSHWCGLFTYEEWEGYEYALDIAFQAGTGFASPVGRAIGVGTLPFITSIRAYPDLTPSRLRRRSPRTHATPRHHIPLRTNQHNT